MKQVKAGNFVLSETIFCDSCETTLKVTGVEMLAFKFSVGAPCSICNKWHEVKLPRNLHEIVMNRPSDFVPVALVVERKAWWDKVVTCEGCGAEFLIEYEDVYDPKTKCVSKMKVVRCFECGLRLYIDSSD